MNKEAKSSGTIHGEQQPSSTVQGKWEFSVRRPSEEAGALSSQPWELGLVLNFETLGWAEPADPGKMPLTLTLGREDGVGLPPKRNQ